MERIMRFAAGLFVVLLLAALPSAAETKTKVDMKDGQGKSVGEIIIRTHGPGVVLYLRLHGLTPGEHAIHFHQSPQCEGPDFKSAGGHFNPGAKKHGFDNPEGHHAGDMKNFTVAADGTAKAEVNDAEVTLKPGPNSLTSNGAAIVIHAKADDYKTDPSGSSGDRVACGVIAK